MSNEKELTRREAIKSIGVGVGVIATLPVLDTNALAQDHQSHVLGKTAMGTTVMGTTARQAAQPLRFFTEEENKIVVEMSERIIPADDSSPGAGAARVNEFLDLIVSESSGEVKKQWREGLAAVNKKSNDIFGVGFAQATEAQQVSLLREISKNERSPNTVEERFFRLIKSGTIDGYYTSEIGIHKELHYKGNSYLKEFPGCTHPEHQGQG